MKDVDQVVDLDEASAEAKNGSRGPLGSDQATQPELSPNDVEALRKENVKKALALLKQLGVDDGTAAATVGTGTGKKAPRRPRPAAKAVKEAGTSGSR